MLDITITKELIGDGTIVGTIDLSDIPIFDYSKLVNFGTNYIPYVVYKPWQKIPRGGKAVRLPWIKKAVQTPVKSVQKPIKNVIGSGISRSSEVATQTVIGTSIDGVASAARGNPRRVFGDVVWSKFR